MLREFVGFGASTVANQASRVGSGLAAAAILGPATWGIWFLLNLIIAYGSLTQLGALNGMNREVPAALGRGDADGAQSVRRTALGVIVAGTGAASLILLLLSALAPHLVAPRDMALMLLLLAAHQAYEYAVTTLRATTRFTQLSGLQFLSSLSYPLLTISGAWFLGLPGFILGQVLTYALLIATAREHMGVAYVARWDRRQARSLVAIGFPIMLVGLVFALFATVDRWVVTAFLGTESLGHYSLAIMSLGAVNLLPQVVSQQYYPRLAHAWAARSDTSELRRVAARVRNATLATTLPVVALLLLTLPPAVRVFLPEFAPGIPALVITAFVPLVSAPGQGYGGVLHMLNRQSWLLVAILVSATLNLGLSITLVAPFGLVGVAAASLASFAFYALARVVLGAIALRREERA